jgi:hypothetical protein
MRRWLVAKGLLRDGHLGGRHSIERVLPARPVTIVVCIASSAETTHTPAAGLNNGPKLHCAPTDFGGWADKIVTSTVGFEISRGGVTKSVGKPLDPKRTPTLGPYLPQASSSSDPSSE